MDEPLVDAERDRLLVAYLHDASEGFSCDRVCSEAACIKTNAHAAGRAAERAEWVAKVEALARDLTPAHNCELRYDGTVDQATAAWVEGRHDAVDALRALVEGVRSDG